MDENLLNFRSQTFKKLNILKKNDNPRNKKNTIYIPTEVPSLKTQQIKINQDFVPSRKNSDYSPITTHRKISDKRPNATPQPYNSNFENQYCSTQYHTIINNKYDDSKSFDYNINNNYSFNNKENNLNFNYIRNNVPNNNSSINQPFPNQKNKIIPSIESCNIKNNTPNISNIIKNYSTNATIEQNNKDTNIYNIIYSDLYYNLNQNKNQPLATISVNKIDLKSRQRSQKSTKINFNDDLVNIRNKMFTNNNKKSS